MSSHSFEFVDRYHLLAAAAALGGAGADVDVVCVVAVDFAGGDVDAAMKWKEEKDRLEDCT